jgi:hypothetical protein
MPNANEAARDWLERFIDMYAGIDAGPGDPVHAVREKARELLEAGPTESDPLTISREIAQALPGDSHAAALEQALVDRIRRAVGPREEREWDVFLSYARIDGQVAGETLQRHLESVGVRVWFDGITIQPGKSQARQMDEGLQKARAGVVLLTPAYLAGRFWTERELGALLHKETVIPVLHGVSFDEVAQYSGILSDLAGFETARDTLEAIARKIAAAVLTG